MICFFKKVCAYWRKITNSNVRLGLKGERLAVRFLKRAGYKILDKNWKCGRYELDIVAKKQNCCVFIEVKGREGIHPLDSYAAVNRSKREALRIAIRAYLNKHKNIQSYRFDICAICWNNSGHILSLNHYENVTLGGH